MTDVTVDNSKTIHVKTGESDLNVLLCCPECNGEIEQDHNSFTCHKCEITLPKGFGHEAKRDVEKCIYPECNCPFDAPADPKWCARGFKRG